MKKRILNFNDYKKVHENFEHSFSAEHEEETTDLVADDMNVEDGGEGEEGDADFDTTDDADTEDVSDESTEEVDENAELREKIKSIIENNYRDTIKDIWTGIENELDDEDDFDVVMDILLDEVQTLFEEVATSGDEEEGTEEGTEEVAPEEGTEEVATEEGTETDGTEEV